MVGRINLDVSFGFLVLRMKSRTLVLHSRGQPLFDTSVSAEGCYGRTD